MKKEKWNKNNIPDLTGKVALVTGSNSGIGYEAVKALAEKNAEVIIAVRNIPKGDSAASKIKAIYPHAKLNVMKLDLSSLDSVRDFTKKFREIYNSLDLLINNAGVMIPPYSKTTEGFELQFGTNHLGHFVLTAELMELIEKSSEGRIVNVSSSAHKFGKIDFEDLNWEKRKYKPWRAYGDSKIANLYFTYELGRRLKKAGSKIKVTSCHPGWSATNLQRNINALQFLSFMGQKPDMGTMPTLRAAIDENVESGDFFGPDGFMKMRGYPVIEKTNKLSRNDEIAAKFWVISEELTNTNFKIAQN